MNRYSIALLSIDNPMPSILALSTNLYSAVIECAAYEHDPAHDPAVQLLVMQLGFVTNADVLSANQYDILISKCRHNAERPNIDPMKVH